MKRIKKPIYERVGEATKNLHLTNSFGKIILLNGTSSSGKSTIAKKLKEKLPEIFFYFPMDEVAEMLPKKIFKNEDKILRQSTNIILGYYYMIDALVRCGNNVIADCVFQETNWFKRAFRILNKYDLLFIGVKCSLEDAERREKQRSDRTTGQARYQFTKVHQFCVYDIEVNTSCSSYSTIVKEITSYYQSGKEFRAFGQTYLNIKKQTAKKK